MSKAKDEYYRFKKEAESFGGIDSSIENYIRELEKENEMLQESYDRLRVEARMEQDQESWRA